MAATEEDSLFEAFSAEIACQTGVKPARIFGTVVSGDLADTVVSLRNRVLPEECITGVFFPSTNAFKQRVPLEDDGEHLDERILPDWLPSKEVTVEEGRLLVARIAAYRSYISEFSASAALHPVRRVGLVVVESTEGEFLDSQLSVPQDVVNSFDCLLVALYNPAKSKRNLFFVGGVPEAEVLKKRTQPKFGSDQPCATFAFDVLVPCADTLLKDVHLGTETLPAARFGWLVGNPTVNESSMSSVLEASEEMTQDSLITDSEVVYDEDSSGSDGDDHVDIDDVELEEGEDDDLELEDDDLEFEDEDPLPPVAVVNESDADDDPDPPETPLPEVHYRIEDIKNSLLYDTRSSLRVSFVGIQFDHIYRFAVPRYDAFVRIYQKATDLSGRHRFESFKVTSEVVDDFVVNELHGGEMGMWHGSLSDSFGILPWYDEVSRSAVYVCTLFNNILNKATMPRWTAASELHLARLRVIACDLPGYDVLEFIRDLEGKLFLLLQNGHVCDEYTSFSDTCPVLTLLAAGIKRHDAPTPTLIHSLEATLLKQCPARDLYDAGDAGGRAPSDDWSILCEATCLDTVAKRPFSVYTAPLSMMEDLGFIPETLVKHQGDSSLVYVTEYHLRIVLFLHLWAYLLAAYTSVAHARKVIRADDKRLYKLLDISPSDYRDELYNRIPELVGTMQAEVSRKSRFVSSKHTFGNSESVIVGDLCEGNIDAAVAMFPPCMFAIIEKLWKHCRIGHSELLTLVTFLARLGFGRSEVSNYIWSFFSREHKLPPSLQSGKPQKTEEATRREVEGMWKDTTEAVRMFKRRVEGDGDTRNIVAGFMGSRCQTMATKAPGLSAPDSLAACIFKKWQNNGTKLRTTLMTLGEKQSGITDIEDLGERFEESLALAKEGQPLGACDSFRVGCGRSPSGIPDEQRNPTSYTRSEARRVAYLSGS